MRLVDTLLLLIAAVCFGLAAAGTVSKRVNLVALGLLLWVLVPLIATARGLS